MKKINLGCGSDIREGWENFDICPRDDEVKKLNLNELPLPFETNSCDVILASHVIEHLDIPPREFVKELQRIVKDDGRIVVRLPTWSNKVNHNRVWHCISYFNGIGRYGLMVKKRRGNQFSLLLMMKRFLALLRDMSYQEYEYILEKK